MISQSPWAACAFYIRSLSDKGQRKRGRNQNSLFPPECPDFEALGPQSFAPDISALWTFLFGCPEEWLPQQESLPSPHHPNVPKGWWCFSALLSPAFYQIQQAILYGSGSQTRGRCMPCLPGSLCEVLISLCSFKVSEPCACGCLSLPGTSALWEEVILYWSDWSP